MTYHFSAALATTRRVLRQLSHDHRTLGMIFIVPVALMSLLRWLYADYDQAFNAVAPALLGIFPFVIMFLITSIATLRERRSGTLERVLVTPIGKLDLVVGYALAFGSLAAIQSLIASSFAIWVLGMDVAGPLWFVVFVALSNALLGTALGLLVSAFAKTEFQAVQFMPALILPQFLLCGLLVPLDKMPAALEKLAYLLPMTYGVSALNKVVSQTTISADMWRDVAIVLLFAVAAIGLGALSLRRSQK